MKRVLPKTYLVGVSRPDMRALAEYLGDSLQQEFQAEWDAARDAGVPDTMCLVSMFAKMCYKSLVPGKNENVTRTRSIADNIASVIDSGHGSVLEHVSFSFITTDCSRVFTHELVRHRVGTAFSQTSGRYVSIDELDMVLPPELCKDDGEPWDAVTTLMNDIEKGLRDLRDTLIDDDMPFADKKRITSAIRRLAPNGQANEIAWSTNLRQARHMIELRTSLAAEWEARLVFQQVADLLDRSSEWYLTGGTEDEDGQRTGLRV